MPKEPKVDKVSKVATKTQDKEDKTRSALSNPRVYPTSDKTLHIPRNVNSYSHFLHHPYITEKDIEWVLKLRNTESDTVSHSLYDSLKCKLD